MKVSYSVHMGKLIETGWALLNSIKQRMIELRQ